MSTPTDLVATPLTMRLGSARLHVDLLWRAMAHPEVLMILHVGGSEAARKEWVLSRELVAAGLLGQAGIGDIRIRCADDDVEIELRSTDGQWHPAGPTARPGRLPGPHRRPGPDRRRHRGAARVVVRLVRRPRRAHRGVDAVTATAHRVQLATTARLDGAPAPVLLRWDTDRPDVVRLRAVPDEVVDQEIPRDLLAAGLAPAGPWVRIVLADPPLRLLVDRADVAEFVARVTDHLVLHRGVEAPGDLGGLMAIWEGVR